MAEKMTRAMRMLKEVRRRISVRLYKAYREGRMGEEMRTIEREADRRFRNGRFNGHRPGSRRK